jgi:uncharacterized protein (TIGR04255 family)
MSKLPNAPLLEVIFELRWQIRQKSDLTKYQYLLGDLYSSLKDIYPIRESLAPPEVPTDILINNPVHRFRKERNQYPLVQLGPGVLTLNTTDNNYFWEEFYELAKKLNQEFFSVFPVENEAFKSNLLYIDFFKFDFKNQNVNEFINDSFNINIEQGFIKKTGNPFHLDLGFYYETDLGNLSVTLKKGKNEDKEDGIVMQTTLRGQESMETVENVLSWLNRSHDFSSDLFKEITKGKLYNSFK